MTASRSESWVRRFGDVIPRGSSTMSKAPKYLPDEPGVIVRGRGCRVWDADGREFIDFRNALGPITLGYGFPAVDEAIRAQLDEGIVFGQPHPLECEVAEMLCQCIPCAEQVRFLKTGGEAVAACIRLARHHTGRDHVIQIGYNGWLSGLAGGGQVLPGRPAAAPAGVPAPLSALHHGCRWNDIERMQAIFDEHDGQVAAVVIAADYARMAAGETFYPAARELTRRKGSVLIFDEIVTGFRVALGGVQEHFGVTPDMAVFAKGIANGMPLSAFVGRRELMQGLQQVVVSSTYGGEMLSLAAARAAIRTYHEQDVIGHLRRQGRAMVEGASALFERHGLPIQLAGLAACPIFVFDPQGDVDAAAGLPEKFFRASYRHGLSFYTLPYVTFSHGDADIAEALERLDDACAQVAASGP